MIPLTKFDHISICDQIMGFFRDNNIPFEENLIGFAADGASVMSSKKNSVAQLLKQNMKNLFSMTCVCHSFAIVASNACEELPRYLEDMMRDIYNYFKNSSKRLASLEEYQKVCNLKPHKILHPSQTRWLSLEAVVKRTLEQYEALRAFFKDAVEKMAKNF